MATVFEEREAALRKREQQMESEVEKRAQEIAEKMLESMKAEWMREKKELEVQYHTVKTEWGE